MSQYVASPCPSQFNTERWQVKDTSVDVRLYIGSHAYCVNMAAALNDEVAARNRVAALNLPKMQAQPDATGDLLDRALRAFGQWEIPLYALGTTVLHKPTGKTCVVRAYCAWEPPVLLYGLEEVGGVFLDAYSHAPDIALVVATHTSASKEPT